VSVADLGITGSNHLHSARHPQVDHPNHACLQLSQEELSLAIETINDLPGQPSNNISRVHVAPAGPDVAQLDFDQPSLFNHRCELTSNSLDFGKFGHRSTVMASPGLPIMTLCTGELTCAVARRQDWLPPRSVHRDRSDRSYLVVDWMRSYNNSVGYTECNGGVLVNGQRCVTFELYSHPPTSAPANLQGAISVLPLTLLSSTCGLLYNRNRKTGQRNLSQ